MKASTWSQQASIRKYWSNEVFFKSASTELCRTSHSAALPLALLHGVFSPKIQLHHRAKFHSPTSTLFSTLPKRYHDTNGSRWCNHGTPGQSYLHSIRLNNPYPITHSKQPGETSPNTLFSFQCDGCRKTVINTHHILLIIC